MNGARTEPKQSRTLILFKSTWYTDLNRRVLGHKINLDTFKKTEIQHLHPSWAQSLSALGAGGESSVGTRLHLGVTSSNRLQLYGPELHNVGEREGSGRL